jgi:hypothetical protein
VQFSESVWPTTFSDLPTDNFLYGNVPQILPAIAIMLAGITLIYLMNKYSVKEE